MEFEVAAADLLRIKPGTCLLPNGVLILEDENKELLIANSSFNADYTVVYQLEDARVLGGSPAQLRLLPGLTGQDAFSDATIIGYVVYPGGSVPLSPSHFIQPSRLRIEPNRAQFSKISSAPFSEAIRPAAELPGSTTIVTTRLTNVTAAQARQISFGGVAARILRAAVLTESTVASDLGNYARIAIKNGATDLFTHDTRPLPAGQGPLTSGSSIALLKSSAITSAFVIPAISAATLQVTEVANPQNAIGDIVITAEVPATSGVWTESLEQIAGEYVSRILNSSNVTSTYLLAVPFGVSGDGQPKKLIARLAVDFNCIVTLQLRFEGTVIPLEPFAGVVSNTGGIVTREFNVPTVANLIWSPGKTGRIEATIQAQPGRAASFAYLALSTEASPFLLFI